MRPQRSTAARFLKHLPQAMSFDLKCEIVRRLQAEYCAQDEYNLKVSFKDWRAATLPLVESLIEKTYHAELPSHIMQELTWLAEDEARIARALLVEAQAQESRNAMAQLEAEFAQLQLTLRAANRDARITHTIKLPYGRITVKIKQ